MKKIMIIGAGDFQLPLVKRASEDYDVVLVAPVISDEFKKYAFSCYNYDVRDKDSILKIAKEEDISGVITDQTDIPVRTVAYIAEKMGLCGIGYETAKIFTDKSLMREKLIEAGLQTIPFVKTDNISEAVRFFEGINSPVIVKPLDTQGSRGVIRVDRASDLDSAFNEAKAFSSNGVVLVEKYIIGDEVVIEGITYNYNVVSQICGDTIYFDDKSKFSAKKRIFPSLQSKEIVDKALSFNKSIIETFGLNSGITHGEYIIDNGEVYLIEIAARGGGVFISSDLINAETNINTEEFLLDIAMGKKPELNIYETNKVAGYRAFYLPEGEVVDIKGVEEVLSFPFIRHHQLDNIKLGMKIGENVNKTSRFALIIVADNYEQWREYEKQVINTLKITCDNNGELRSIIWE